MAKDLWERICLNAVKSGEPGFLFEDNIRKNFATSYFEEYSSPNPCGESLIPTDGNCNLGSINLLRMFSEETHDVDWSLLAKTIGIAVRMMDDVLTMNVYPTPETKVAAERSRRIGLGVMGLHHLLIKLGLRYGSNESLEFIERLFATIRNEAFMASVDIAKEKGSYSEYDYDKYIANYYISHLPTRILKAIKQHGIRNAVILSIAPTGSLSMVAGTSSGIEPIFAPMYNRKYRIGNVLAEEIVVDKMFSNAVETGSWDHIVGAYDVTPQEHMAVQAAVQDYVDQAIAKTINVPKDFSHEELMELILNYSDRLKGLTIYREGSRENEPLQAIKTTQENVEKYAMNKDLAGIVNSQCNTGSCEL
jgi:ribonucleoside-diphosphate reductase alpha chain